MPGPTNPLLPRLLATADVVAAQRSEVDRDMAREVLQEAATSDAGLHDPDTVAAVYLTSAGILQL